MKGLVLSIFALTSSLAWACKPVPLRQCFPADMMNVDSASFKVLQEKTEAFQQLLSKSIPLGSATNSCFNNHFATYYLSGLTEPQTCPTQIEQIKNAVNGLINPESEEWKSVTKETDKKRLEKFATEVKNRLEVFLKKHSKSHP